MHSNVYSITGALVAMMTASSALAQTSDAAKGYPVRAVRIVNPSSPGGGADIIGRLIGQHLAKALGQNVITDNRPGAANIIATEVAAKAPPDGYTLLMATTGTFVTNPLVYAKLSYSDKDFETISNVADAPFILTVHPSVPAKNVSELTALARSRPGELTYASFGTGSSSHLAGELFRVMTGTRLLHVPYKGSAPGMADMLAGNITMKFDSGLASIPHIQSRRIRALGVAAPQRLPQVPDVPTLDQAGLKNFEAGSWYGIMAPAGTPREILTKLHAELVNALKVPEVQQRITDLAAHVIGNTPGEFRQQIVRERERWARVVKEAGIKPE
ncbi:MAG: Bug family tripartite tricarboxylate transporter substrate binding protein [Burkholderiales bacterium]